MRLTKSKSSTLGTKRPRCSLCGAFVGEGGVLGEENYCKKCAEKVEGDKDFPWEPCPLCAGSGEYLGNQCHYCSGLGYRQVKA